MRPTRARGRAGTGAPADGSPGAAPVPAAGLARALDAERRRIAADLHDRSGPNLATVAMNLALLEKRLAGRLDPELVALLAQSRVLLSRTVAAMRDLSAELRPARLAYAGLLAALAERIEQFRARTGTTVHWSANWSAGPIGDGNAGAAPSAESIAPKRRLGVDQEWLLYHVVQEALVNCEKHARAGHVRIELLEQEDHITLHIADDGIGFDPQGVARQQGEPGLGLLIMRERIEEAQGHFELVSAPGQGTHIRITLPLKPA